MSTTYIYKTYPIRFFYLILACFYGLAQTQAQVPKVYIQEIRIEGNKKTRPIAVLRYMNIKIGDGLNLPDLMPTLRENERLIMNSRLFTDVKINVENWQDSLVSVVLHVHEAWYFFPIPIFELADRNFNVWWRDFHRDFRRINAGLYLLWRNPIGYNDYLKLVAQFGFTRKFELDYLLPPIDKKQRWGYAINVLYSDNKELAYDTKDNILLFYRDLNTKEKQFQRFRAGLTLSFRQSVFDKHSFTTMFKSLAISDSIAIKNPDFFLNGVQKQRSFVLEYDYTRDKRDIQNYPLNGHYFNLRVKKRGLGIFQDINQLWFTLNIGLYKQWHKRFSTSLYVEGRYSAIRGKQPYWQQEAIGYFDSYLRGYQYYAMNGQDYVLLRSDLNFKALDVNIPLFPASKIVYLQKLPFKIHTRLHLDYGYVQDPYYFAENPLNNKHLIGFGPGVDLVFYYYNLIIQTEYSINNLGEKDLYLRFKFNF